VESVREEKNPALGTSGEPYSTRAMKLFFWRETNTPSHSNATLGKDRTSSERAIRTRKRIVARAAWRRWFTVGRVPSSIYHCVPRHRQREDGCCWARVFLSSGSYLSLLSLLSLFPRGRAVSRMPSASGAWQMFRSVPVPTRRRKSSARRSSYTRAPGTRESRSFPLFLCTACVRGVTRVQHRALIGVGAAAVREMLQWFGQGLGARFHFE